MKSRAMSRALKIVNLHLHQLDVDALQRAGIKVPERYEIDLSMAGAVCGCTAPARATIEEMQEDEAETIPAAAYSFKDLREDQRREREHAWRNEDAD